jgi:4-diphosphocytidyl-2-C-methyl-D-erythritol kinase
LHKVEKKSRFAAKKMVVFPNSKINIGLNITAKRVDGFHDLNTLFYPLSLADCLEIIPSVDGKTTFTSSGIPIPSDGSKNLCEKAYALLHAQFGIQAVKIHLHKVVPIGAGLGGGSADASYTLMLLKDMFSLDISKNTMIELAAVLGSDCAFFIENTPSMATGRGEILQPIPFSLKGMYLVLVMPPIHIGTKEAFAGIKPQNPDYDIFEMTRQPLSEWRGKVINDFENGIFTKYPQIAQIREKLYDLGAEYASMSGSGAAVFGLFKDFPDTDLMNLFPGCFVWKETLRT